jgi:hypothetical protein
MARASKRASVPAKGDYYPTVRAWCQRLGVTDLDIRANEVMVDQRTCRIYVAAVMGPAFPLRFRRLPSSVGRGGADYIVLDTDTIKAKQLSLGTVLHECAHAVQLTKLRDRRLVRREARVRARVAGARPPVQQALPARRDMHGEAFSRTYARLLRDTLT